MAKTTKETKINLGCGEDYKRGWINIDNSSMGPCKVDVLSNILDFHQEPNTVDKILLSHVVMYLRPEDLDELLPRWLGWLKKGGSLEIETVDLKKVMQIALNESDPYKVHFWGLSNIFGTESTGPHRWGWMSDRLVVKLYRSGFIKIKYAKGVKKPERDFRLIATK